MLVSGGRGPLRSIDLFLDSGPLPAWFLVFCCCLKRKVGKYVTFYHTSKGPRLSMFWMYCRERAKSTGKSTGFFTGRKNSSPDKVLDKNLSYPISDCPKRPFSFKIYIFRWKNSQPSHFLPVKSFRNPPAPKTRFRLILPAPWRFQVSWFYLYGDLTKLIWSD